MRGEITVCRPSSWFVRDKGYPRAGGVPRAVTPPRGGTSAPRAAPPRSGLTKLGAYDRHELVGRPVEPVVYDHMLELRLGGQFRRRGREPSLHLIGGVGAAGEQTLAQGLSGGRRDEDLDGVGQLLFDLPGSLHLD